MPSSLTFAENFTRFVLLKNGMKDKVSSPTPLDSESSVPWVAVPVNACTLTPFPHYHLLLPLFLNRNLILSLLVLKR